MVTTRSAQPLRIDRVRRQLDRWRQRRAHPRSPIPDAIWAAAVALARQHGVYRTARALRVDYGTLKRHVETADTAIPASPAFVELPARPSGDAAACVIEIEGPRATLRLRVPTMALPDLATLGRLLAGVEP